jgi:transcriptional regulator with XRE-family HTH domain
MNINDLITDNEYMNLKTRLSTLLTREGLSITDLSKQSDVPVQTLHNWISGMEPRSLKQVKRVAKVFSLSVDELCFGEDQSGEINDYQDEINAGVFEVVLRRVKNRRKQ